MDLQDRVRTYYQKMWDNERSLTTNPDEFIDEVSKPLSADIKMKLYHTLLENVDFFKSASEIVVEELVKCLTNHLYLEGDVIMRKGEAGSWMVRPDNRPSVCLPLLTPSMLLRLLASRVSSPAVRWPFSPLRRAR